MYFLNYNSKLYDSDVFAQFYTTLDQGYALRNWPKPETKKVARPKIMF